MTLRPKRDYFLITWGFTTIHGRIHCCWPSLSSPKPAHGGIVLPWSLEVRPGPVIISGQWNTSKSNMRPVGAVTFSDSWCCLLHLLVQWLQSQWWSLGATDRETWRAEPAAHGGKLPRDLFRLPTQLSGKNKLLLCDLLISWDCLLLQHDISYDHR